MKPKSQLPACEIITIGTELLLGQILDTNTTYLAQELGHMGVAIRFRTAVGDHLEEMTSTIQSALQRCDVVLTTGGLGPTLDDLTREAVAQVAGVKLEFRQDLMDQIESMFRRAGYNMPENNRRQAFVPQGSHAIPNPVGTAPPFIVEVDGKPVICLPGVPRELKVLLASEVIPWLRKRFNLSGHQVTYRVLKTVGIGESKVDRLIGNLIKPGDNPEVGLLASMGEIKIRIAARAQDEAAARNLIDPIEEEIRTRLGKTIYGANEDTLEGVIDALLSQQERTLSIFETFSGGLAAERLYRLPSECLIESHVIPDKDRVIRWFGVEKSVESETAVLLFARKLNEITESGMTLAIVGFPNREKDGYALKGYAAVAGTGIEEKFSWQMGGDFMTLQQRGATIGLNTLRLALLKEQGGGGTIRPQR